MDFSENNIRLPKLNLPDFEPVLNEIDGQLFIWDGIRKKNLVLTPEEWVRQHWIHYLVSNLDYPKGLFSLEKGMKYNQLQKRTDIFILDADGEPYLLIECKAPKVKISQKTMEQAAMYHNKLKSRFLILSNGLHHISLEWNYDKLRFDQIQNLPVTPKIV